MSDEADALLEELARLLAPKLVPHLAPLLANVRAQSGPDEVDLATVPPGKRRCYAAARSGEIEGAIKLLRRWYAPRQSYARWYEQWRAAKGTRPPPSRPETTGLDALRTRMGFVLVDPVEARLARMGLRLDKKSRRGGS